MQSYFNTISKRQLKSGGLNYQFKVLMDCAQGRCNMATFGQDLGNLFGDQFAKPTRSIKICSCLAKTLTVLVWNNAALVVQTEIKAQTYFIEKPSHYLISA